MCLFYCGVVPEILKNETPQTHFPFALVVFLTVDASTTIKAFLQFFPSLQMLENAQGCLSTDFKGDFTTFVQKNFDNIQVN